MPSNTEQYINQAIRDDLETSKSVYDLLQEKNKNDAYYKDNLTNNYNHYSLVNDYIRQTQLNGTLTHLSYYLAAVTVLYFSAFISQVFPAAIMLSNVAQLILPLATAVSVAIVHGHRAYINRSFDHVISNFCTVHEATLQAIDEEQRQATENTAATKIQSILRTRIPRELLQGLKKDKEDIARREKNVSTLQTWASGLKNKTNSAATTISNAYRAYKAKNKLNSLKTATAERTALATRIQNAVRTYLAKNKLNSLKTAKAEQNAATKIQSLLRTMKPKQLLQDLKKDNSDTARRANNISTLQIWASGLNKNETANAKEIAAASIEAGNDQPVSSQSLSNVAKEKTTASTALQKARQAASLGSQTPEDGMKTADLFAELAKQAAQKRVENGTAKKANETAPRRRRKGSNRKQNHRGRR